jgi:hypothetical protein
MAKRDNAYFRRRLEAEHPGIWKDLNDGKYSSERAAFIAAGLRSERTRLNELKNAWTKASSAEQRDFLQWLKMKVARHRSPSHAVGAISPPPPIVSSAAPPPPHAVIDSAGRLTPWATKRVSELIAKRGILQSDVLAEMGFKKLNPSLSLALRRGNRIHDVRLASALEKWIFDHEHL